MTFESFFQQYPILRHLLLIIGIAIISRIISKIVISTMNRFIAIRKVEHAGLTQLNFVRNISKGIIYFSGILVAMHEIPSLKEFSTSLFASAGVVAAIIGFASQTTISNFISGVFIVLFKPIRVGDYIEIDLRFNGVVENITLRHTTLRNSLGLRVVIPNSVLNTATLINFNMEEEAVRATFDFFLDSNQDLQKAVNIMKHQAENHPKTIDHRTEEALKENLPIVEIRLISVDERGALLRGLVWGANPDDASTLKNDLLMKIHKIFIDEGILFSRYNTPDLRLNQ